MAASDRPWTRAADGLRVRGGVQVLSRLPRLRGPAGRDRDSCLRAAPDSLPPAGAQPGRLRLPRDAMARGGVHAILQPDAPPRRPAVEGPLLLAVGGLA